MSALGVALAIAVIVAAPAVITAVLILHGPEVFS